MATVLAECNATVIAMFKSIVDNGIAGENNLKVAQDLLNKWNHDIERFPNIFYIEETLRNFLYLEKRNVLNRWTLNSCSELYYRLEQFILRHEGVYVDTVRSAANQLSDSTKTLHNDLIRTVNGEYATAADCERLYIILVEYIDV